MTPPIRSTRAHPRWRDIYIALLLLAATTMFVFAAISTTSDDWNAWGALILFAAMLTAERLSVLVPREAKVSIATIPHIVAVLLLPPWLTMLLAGSSMLVDQLAARSALRKVLFNVASIVLTVGVTAVLADRVGLERDALGRPEYWLQMPGFLLVAATYYASTNGLASIVMSLDGGEPAWRIFLDTTSFTLPAEFAVCGIGGLVAILWQLSPAWAPLMLFPVVVSQAALSYISASKRSHARLEFVADASRVLGLSLDKAELPGRVAELVVPALADTCQMYLLAEDGSLQQAACAYASTLRSRQRLTSSGSEPDLMLDLTAWTQAVLSQGQSMLSSELSAQTEPQLAPAVKRQLNQMGLRSCMIVPLETRGRLLGALVLLSLGSYETDDLALAQDLAHRCAVAIDNARLHAAAQQASRLRDEFLSVAAHELKTPLTSLRGYAQLIGRMLESDEALDTALLSKGFRVIDAQSEKLGRLTHQLLDVSRIESGKLQLEPQQVDLSALVQSVATAAQATTSNHVVHVEAPEPCIAAVDPLRLEQVISNLLSNAIKYSPEGGRVELTLVRSNGGVALEVRDWGVGIPPERRGQLFDRFYQAHGSGHFGGLGLGLYISRQIVELHGGNISVDFPDDGGTRFVVHLPGGIPAQAVDVRRRPTGAADRSLRAAGQHARSSPARLHFALA